MRTRPRIQWSCRPIPDYAAPRVPGLGLVDARAAASPPTAAPLPLRGIPCCDHAPRRLLSGCIVFAIMITWNTFYQQHRFDTAVQTWGTDRQAGRGQGEIARDSTDDCPRAPRAGLGGVCVDAVGGEQLRWCALRRGGLRLQTGRLTEFQKEVEDLRTRMNDLAYVKRMHPRQKRRHRMPHPSPWPVWPPAAWLFAPSRGLLGMLRVGRVGVRPCYGMSRWRRRVFCFEHRSVGCGAQFRLWMPVCRAGCRCIVPGGSGCWVMACSYWRRDGCAWVVFAHCSRCCPSVVLTPVGGPRTLRRWMSLPPARAFRPSWRRRKPDCPLDERPGPARRAGEPR